MTWTLGALAEALDVNLRGNAEHVIDSVGTLNNAVSSQLSFLANPSYRSQLKTSQAGAVILSATDAEDFAGNALISDHPYLTYALAAAYFQPRPSAHQGIHASAVVDPSANIDESVYVGPQAVIERDVSIGPGTRIGAGCIVEKGASIGAQTVLRPRVVICNDVHIGSRVLLHPGAVVGADGFGIAPGNDGNWVKVPQLGSVRMGDDCEVGANSTIDRGAIEDTVLGNDVQLDNLVQIGHNVVIGDHTAIAGAAAVGGSATIGRNCLIGGGVGVCGHIEIVDGVTVTARTLVTHSIRQVGVYSSGSPMEENSRWRKNTVRVRQLDKLARTVAQLAKDSKA